MATDTEESPRRDPPRRRAVGRWWNRATKVVLGAGALAGAVGAIIGLWPAPDPEDSAQITSVSVTAGVPISEFRQRSTELTPRSAARPGDPVLPQVLLVAADGGTPSPSAPGSDPTQSPDATAAPSTETKPPSAATPDPTSSPATPTPTTTDSTGNVEKLEVLPGAPLVLPSGITRVQAVRLTDDVLSRVQDREPQLDIGCATTESGCQTVIQKLVVSASLDPDGKPVKPAVAAERVVKVLKQTRTVRSGHKREPVGAVVTVNVDLSGLRGEPLLLSWSIWQQGGGKRLLGRWLDDNLAYRLKPTSQHDTGSVDLWVPLPKAKGHYFVRLALSDGTTRLASADSEPFR
jgi:hypothetical protein